jgi:hypothetical protein
MLWVHHEEGLMDGYILQAVDGRPIGKGRERMVIESGSVEVILAVTTETRNQRGGFVTLLNPQLLTILDIAEIRMRLALARFLPGQKGKRSGLEAFVDLMISMRHTTRSSI